MAERLQKYLARAGVASRRKSEEFIVSGRVTVNGETVTELGSTVEPTDVIYFDGRPVEPEPLEYYLLNKPLDVVSSASDPHGRRTVTQLVRSGARLFPVGRLDQDTTGLIILTNDGELAHRLMHPSFEVDKVYVAEVRRAVSATDIKRLSQGIELEDGLTAPAKVRVTGRQASGDTVEIVIHQGRKRQVRRMLEAVGHPVASLHRRQYAMLTDRGLAPGASRPLKPKELKALQKLTKKEER